MEKVNLGSTPYSAFWKGSQISQDRQRVQRLVCNASSKRIGSFASYILLVLAAIFLFRSTPSADPEPFRAGVDAHLKDTQCASVLEGGSDAIICHVKLASRKFEDMKSRQSQTYMQAHDQYVEQYGRQPPPGFNQWFHFAQKHVATIVDDYGQLETDLAPLRKVSKSVLRQRMKNALESMPSLYRWDFANGNVTTTAPMHREDVRTFHEILSPILQQLPQLTVLHNWDAAHRVCGPKDRVENVHSTEVRQVGTTGRPSSELNLIQGCPRNTATRSPNTSDRPSIDLCTHTKDWRSKHGFYHVPNSCFDSDVPVLSASKTSSFQDISTIPWYFASPHFRLSNGQTDTIPYAKKKPHLYWRGASTGNFGRYEDAYFGHRQRLVMFTQQMRAKATELAAKSSNMLGIKGYQKRLQLPNMPETFTSSQLLALSRLNADTFDMNFVDLVNCEGTGPGSFCDEWKAKFPLSPREPPPTAFQNKFVMDVDGHGASPSFYRLLDSNSLVFKQTIFAEWHDDRIIPWLHYVPVSMGMEELPILIDFFANDPRGQKLGETMASASSEWASTSLRKIDLSIFIYRQLLELANIVGHD